MEIERNKNQNKNYKWRKMGAAIVISKKSSVPNLQFILQYIFCMPLTSAPVKIVLSLMHKAWSDEWKYSMRPVKLIWFNS